MEATAMSLVKDTKDIILEFIDKTPGIRYRELLRLTDLTNGVLTYHLAILERANRIRVARQSRMTRYYLANITTEESDIIGCLRPHTARQITLLALQHDLCTFNEIVEYTKKAPSTISWNLKKLQNAGIVLAHHGECVLYRVADREAIARILLQYKESFIDKLVDNYTEMMEEL